MAKNAHLTLSERIIIESCLRDGMSFKQIAQKVDKDPSTISKEIRGHYKVIEKESFNPCSRRRECQHFSDICNPCQQKFGKFCRQCNKVKCFTVCQDFEKMVCLKLSKPPYVCNGCKERSHCKLRRHIYDAKFAQNEYEAVRSESRQGFATEPAELRRIDNIISPLVKQGQSVHQICSNNADNYMALTIRESTMDSYRTMTKHYIKPYLGKEKIGSITTADIQQLYNWLRENGRVNEHYEKGNALSDSMVRSIHMMLHQAMDAAVRERLIVKNPTEGTVIPKNNYPPKQILTEEQLERFLEVVRQDPVWSDFFYTELTTGLRLGEICGLKWQDFEEKTGRLHIRRSVHKRKGGGVRVGETKTETGARTILLPPSTVEVLKARKKKSYSDWIFHNPVVPEVPMDPSTAYHRLKTLLRHAELPSIRFHDLRHTFATHALTSGVDAKTLSTILGHTNASFTLDTYTHMTTDMHRKAATVVGGFLDEIM